MGSQQQGPDLELVIKQMQREIRELQTSSRLPQISSRAVHRLQAVSDTSALTGRANDTWGPLQVGGPPSPTVATSIVPVLGRTLLQFGCYMGALTNLASVDVFGTFDTVSCGLLVKGGPNDGSPPSTIIHAPQNEAAHVHVRGTDTVVARSQVSAASAFVLDATGYEVISVEMQFIRANIHSAQTYFTYPWLVVQPL